MSVGDGGHISISVVVPVLNEERYIRECLGSLVAQDYPRGSYEIVVADGGSSDLTRELVTELAGRYGNIRLVDNPGRIVSCGRNVGIRESRGDVVVIVEGHARVAPDFLSHISRLLADTGASCLGRYVESMIEGDSYLQRAIGLVRKSVLGRNVHSLRFSVVSEQWVSPQSVATIYRRSLLDSLGLYDEEMDTNEDVELNYRVERMGVRAYMSPRICYWLHPRSSLVGLFRQAFRYGQGKRLLVRKHPAACRLSYSVPSAFVLAVGASLPLALWEASCRLPLAAVLGVYAAAVATASVMLAVRHGFRYLPAVPMLFPVMHTAFGLGYLVGRPRRKAVDRRVAAGVLRRPNHPS